MEPEDLREDFIPAAMTVFIDEQKLCCGCGKDILPGKAMRDGRCYFHNYGCCKIAAAIGHKCGCGKNYLTRKAPCGAPRPLAICAPHSAGLENPFEAIPKARSEWEHNHQQMGPNEFFDLHSKAIFRAMFGERLNAAWEWFSQLFRRH